MKREAHSDLAECKVDGRSVAIIPCWITIDDEISQARNWRDSGRQELRICDERLVVFGTVYRDAVAIRYKHTGIYI